MNKRTNVVFFCSTIKRDSTYKLILEMLEKKKVNVMTYDHFLDGKENILTSILEELNNDLETKEQEKIKKDLGISDPKQKFELFPKEELKERKERNKISIKPVVHLALESHEILGYDYFPTLYSNIYIYMF